MKQKRFTSYILLIISAVVWGAASVIVKPAFNITTPFRFLMYRYLFAVVFSLPLLIYYWKKQRKKWQMIKTIIPLEIIGTTLALALFYSGLARTTAIEAGLITTTTPLMMVLAGVLFLKEKEEKHEKIGLGIALLGTIGLVVAPVVLSATNVNITSLEGNLLIVGQNLATVLYLVLAKKNYHRMPKMLVVSVSFWIGLISFFALSWFETGFVHPTTLLHTIKADFAHQSVWVAGLYMAIFGSIIGLTAYIKGQDGIEASEATLFSYLQPLIYIPLAIWLLNESISIIEIGSMVLILSGVIFAEIRTKKKRRTKRISRLRK